MITVTLPEPFTSEVCSSDGKLGRQRLFFHDERMVARTGERRGQPGKNTFSIVLDRAGFSMHQRLRPNDFAAKGFTNGLVAETDPKNRRFPGHVPDERHQNPGLVRRARPRRKQNALRLHGLDFLRSHLVVAPHHHFRTQLAEVLDEVVREGVVVVEDEDHGRFQCSAETLELEESRARLSVN